MTEVAKAQFTGNVLKKGDKLYSYLINVKGRNALLVYLDTKERMKEQ